MTWQERFDYEFAVKGDFCGPAISPNGSSLHYKASKYKGFIEREIKAILGQLLYAVPEEEQDDAHTSDLRHDRCRCEGWRACWREFEKEIYKVTE